MDDECKNLILQFAASYTVADHLGDVARDIRFLLDEIGFDGGEWYDQNELAEILAEQGVTTLYGSSLREV